MSNELLLPLKRNKKPGNAIVVWTKCAPFVENSRGVLIHRPRTVMTYKISARWKSHIGIGYWCGSSVAGSKNFTFLSAPPEGSLLCEKCEIAAIAAGLPSADELAQRHVHRGKIKAIQTCCGAKP